MQSDQPVFKLSHLRSVEPHCLPAALMKSCLVEPLHVLSGETQVKLNPFITHHPPSTDFSLNREGGAGRGTVLWTHSEPVLWFDIVQIKFSYKRQFVIYSKSIQALSRS